MKKRQRRKLSHRAWVKMNNGEDLTPFERQLIQEDIKQGFNQMKYVIENIGPSLAKCALSMGDAIKRWSQTINIEK